MPAPEIQAGRARLGLASKSGWVLAGLLAGLLASYTLAQAAESPPPAGTTPAATGAPSPGGGPYQAGADASQPSDSSGQQPGNPESSAAATQGAQPPVCFQLTQRCIDSKPGTGSAGAKGQASVSRKDSATPQRPLNLNAPDVRTVVPAEELREPLQTQEEQSAAQEADTVQVKGESDAPDVPGGFGALWWAMRHPAEAWRIVAPVE
jgi:hypothetical protein